MRVLSDFVLSSGPGRTIFDWYVENGNRAGFLVVRLSWHQTVAEIISVAGRREGALPGEAPTFNGARVKALVTSRGKRGRREVVKLAGAAGSDWRMVVGLDVRLTA